MKNRVQAALELVTCPVGPCQRVRGHKGPHDDACESSDDTVRKGVYGEIPTAAGVAALRELVDEVERRQR